MSFIQLQLSGDSFDEYEDHTGTVSVVVGNPLSSVRSKHVDVRRHIIRALVQCK